MPVLYRYLLAKFYKYFFLALLCSLFGAFITRISKLSNILALQNSLLIFFKFFIHYMHLLTPFAIAFACCIANAAILKDLFAKSHINSIYAATIDYKKVIAPLCANILIWFLFTLYSTCQLAPNTELRINEWLLEKCSFNPLILLKKSTQKSQNPWFLLGNINDEKNKIEDFALTLSLGSRASPIFFGAKSSIYRSDQLEFQNAQIITPTKKAANNTHSFTHISMPVNNIAKILTNRTNTKLIKCLPFQYLLKKASAFEEIEYLLKEANSLKEIAYRFSLALFTPSLSALVFIYFKNSMKNRTQYTLLFLLITTFLSFFVAKGISSTQISSILYILPHILIFLLFLNPGPKKRIL